MAAFLWSANAILFAEAGKRIGALSVNAFRVIVAALFLIATHLIFYGAFLPAASKAQWFWLGISGIIGLGIADFALFAAFVMIGPRLSLLLLSLVPVYSAIFSYLILGEVLGAWALIGIAVTLAGIIIVILEKEDQKQDEEEKKGEKRLKRIGLLLGTIAALAQGVGLVFSKFGMIRMAVDPAKPLAPLPATLIRMVVAALFIWLCIALAGKLPWILGKLRDKRALQLSSAGAFIGSFLGVWMSMVAVTYIYVGIAQTLMSLMPIMIIPMVWIAYGERTSWRGMLGAFVAVAGAAILFLA
jgi:drug/metabolite transporter (DMT)-like permease